MVTTSLGEIFAGNIPRIDDIVIFLDQAHRSGLAGSMSGATQVNGNHLVGFNTNFEYLDNSVKKWFFNKLVDHFKIENPILITRRGGGFRVECGELPECFRTTFSLKYCPSFRELSLLPKVNREMLNKITAIKEYQANLDRGVYGFAAYGNTFSMWRTVRELNAILESLEQSVS